MRNFIALGVILVFIFSLSNALAEKKRDSFSYEMKSGDFKAKEDWFGSQKKTRKQMEDEKAAYEKEALRNETEKRKALIENQLADQEADSHTKPVKIDQTKMESDKKQLQSNVKAGSNVHNTVQQNIKAIRERTDYPTTVNTPNAQPQK